MVGGRAIPERHETPSPVNSASVASIEFSYMEVLSYIFRL